MLGLGLFLEIEEVVMRSGGRKVSNVEFCLEWIGLLGGGIDDESDGGHRG